MPEPVPEPVPMPVPEGEPLPAPPSVADEGTWWRRLDALLGRLTPLPYLVVGFSIVYFVTRYPGVGGNVNHGDSAKFQFIGQVLGLSHPPGNPLYMLLNAAWVRLPLPFRIATKVTLLSSLFGVVTVAFVYRTLARIWSPRIGLAGAIALGLGPLFWNFSTEAEVYTLNTALLAAACYYAAVFAETGKERPFLLGALFYSLGFANHLTMAALVPAFLWLTFARFRRGSDLRLRDIPLVLLFLVLSASLYLYMPWRFRAGTVYSEFGDTLDWPSFWGYVTAKQFQGSFGQFTYVAGVRERMPALLTLIQKQWMWPMLLVFPTAVVSLRARAPLFFWFVSTAVLSLLFFAFEYDISDPDGFYMPVVLLLTFGIGAAMASFELRWPRASWFVLGTLLAIPALARVFEWRHEDGCEVVEGMDNETGVVLWDLDDLFAHLPEGSTFAVPCSHYGCTEVLNYYRFAEPVIARRRISFVRFPNSQADYWDTPTKVEQVEYEIARDKQVCTIRKPDADAMRARRIHVDEELRPTRDVHQGTVQGATIYCSRPHGRP
jgi:hypothetical protein